MESDERKRGRPRPKKETLELNFGCETLETLERIFTNQGNSCDLSKIEDQLEVIIGLLKPQPPVEGETVFVFNQVRVGGIVIKGDIKEMKIEFGQYVDVTAVPKKADGGVGNIEAGSAAWSVAATDGTGGDASADYVISDNPNDPGNELSKRVQHSGTGESTALVTLNADGDADLDEAAPVIGTLAIVADEPNVVAFDITGTVGTPAPVPNP